MNATKPLLFLGLLISLGSKAQDSLPPAQAFHISKLPPEGIVLDKGWKFHTGDNPEWANPDFNDSDWNSLSPDIDIHHLLKQNKDASIGWFRLKIKLDSSLQDSSVALVISQVVASEIYLNGQLLYRFGVINDDYSKEETYTLRDRPFIIHFSRHDTQELAIRYSFNPKKFIFPFLSNPCVRLMLKSPNQGFANYTSTNTLNFCIFTGLIAINLLLSLFCFFVYFSFRNAKAYLFVGLYTFGQATSLVLYLIADFTAKSISLSSFIFIFANCFSAVGVILFFNALYIFFGYPKPRYYNFFIFFAIVTIPISFLFYDWGMTHIRLFFLIMFLELFRVSSKASMKRRPGAWIILIMTCSIILSQIAALYLGILHENYEAQYFTAVAFSIWPICLSFFLAAEFARSGLTLQKRAIEVKQLSDKTIAQEQEKQQILATQNEKLEAEVQHRTAALNKSLQELKSTQAQLIQSEKMASLGQLTAGIAHEIQNPLNFVNNFSEINKELLVEMKGEMDKGNIIDAKAIANDVIDNHEKINHHGKKADAIVKGMLQHSRSGGGQKEPTDINALCDEYLRLAHHGMRAKDKFFNATTKTEFDNNLGKVIIVPQEIGRVILNLINNAFYTISEKQKQSLNGFEPIVTVRTSKHNGIVEISVKDNGNGIPQKVLDKIFQPFYTTKPTGQGTGLGLSLSYDIIKAHNGDIKVNTKEGEGSEFVISLPIK